MNIFYLETSSLPNNSWFFDGDSYFYFSNSHLPILGIEYEETLKELGIPYKFASSQKGTAIYFWNPDFYEMEEKSAPCYVMEDMTYKYIFYHTGNVFTEHSIRAAKDLIPKIYSCKNIQNREALMNFLLKELNGKTCIGLNANIPYDFPKEDLTLYDGTNHLEVFCVSTICHLSARLLGFAVFDMNKIKSKSYLKMRVPQELHGYFQNYTSSWAKKLNLRKVLLFDSEQNEGKVIRF